MDGGSTGEDSTGEEEAAQSLTGYPRKE